MKDMFKSLYRRMLLNERLEAEETPRARIELTGSPVNFEAAADGESATPAVEMQAYNGGVMQIWGEPLIVDLRGVQANDSIPLLRSHDRERIVGHGTPQNNGEAISLNGVLSAGRDSGEVADLLTLSRNGFPWQASIGANILASEMLPRGKKRTINGRSVSGPVRVVTRSELVEASLVPIGADTSSSVAIAAEDDQDTATGDGSSENGGNADGGNAAAGNAAAGSGVAAAGTNPFAAIQEARRRREQIETTLSEAVTAGAIDADLALELQNQWNANGRPLEGLQLELMQRGRADRMGYSHGNQQSRGLRRGNQLTNGVIEAALLLGCGYSTDSAPEADVEAARRQFPDGIGILTAMNLVARANGYQSHTTDLNEDVLAYALPQRGVVLARGPSTYNLNGILSNVANKAVTDAFNYVESAWRAIAQIASTNDFKEMSNYAPLGDFEFQELAPGGEIKHATMGEELYGNRAKTYARRFVIDRRDLINDDARAFDGVRTKLGRGAALALNKIFWTEFLRDRDTWWTLARGNRLEGANTIMDIDSVSAAEELFNKQVDPDGNPLGSEGRILLGGPKYSTTMLEISQHIGKDKDGNSAPVVYTTGNPHVGRFQTVMSRYLSSPAIPNSSDEHWALLADPMDLPTIQVAFYRGRQMPMIESAAADFDHLGVQLRGFYDFGVRKQAYQASVLATGVVAAVAGGRAKAAESKPAK